MPHNHASNDSVFALSKHQGLCSKHTHTPRHIHTQRWDDDGCEEITDQGPSVSTSHLNTQCT